MHKVSFTYDQLHDFSHELIEKIQNSDFRPTCIVAIAMGGLPIGYHLIKGLNISQLYTIQVQSYRGTAQGMLHDYKNNLPDVSEHSVLLVDDLVDTGKTVEYVRQTYLSTAKEVRLATRIYKTSSTVIPEFFVKTYADERLVFPYEVFEK